MQLGKTSRLLYATSFVVHPRLLAHTRKFPFLPKYVLSKTNTRSFAANFNQIYKPPDDALLQRLKNLMVSYHSVQQSCSTSFVEEENIDEAISEERLVTTDKVEEYIYTAVKHLSQGLLVSPDKWKTLQDELCQDDSSLTGNNFDCIVISICSRDKIYWVARSYLEYVESIRKPPSVYLMSKYLSLHYLCAVFSEEEEVMRVISILKARYKIFDAYTAEDIIKGLSMTSQWKDCIEYFSMIHFTCKPNARAYSAFIQAAFRNKHYDLGWEYVEKMMVTSKEPREEVIHSWIAECEEQQASELKDKRLSPVFETCKEKSDSVLMMEKLLHFFAAKEMYPSWNVMDRIKRWFEAVPGKQWKGHFTTAHKRGYCRFCLKKLDGATLSKEDFDALQQAVLNMSLKKNDVFVNTTPAELERFTSFLTKTAPYDIVLDGLNIGYHHSKKRGLKHANVLAAVVKYFVDKSKKVLVLGRDHMRHWSANDMNYIHRNAHVFTTFNLSKDDPFLLYATMYSGLGTCFLSHDLFRNHAFVLEDVELQQNFRRWQLQHQIFWKYRTDTESIVTTGPAPYLTFAQCTDTTWHVPYDDGKERDGINPPESWLCLLQQNKQEELGKLNL